MPATETKEKEKQINLNIEIPKPKIPDIPQNSSIPIKPDISSIVQKSNIPSIVQKPNNNDENINLPDETYDVSFCCSGRTSSCDKGLLEFFAKTTVSFSVLSFCFISLLNNTGDSAFLSSTISLILGTYLGSQITPPPPNSR